MNRALLCGGVIFHFVIELNLGMRQGCVAAINAQSSSLTAVIILIHAVFSYYRPQEMKRALENNYQPPTKVL